MVALHGVLGASTKRLVRSHHRARRLDDVAFRRERPEVVDRVRAGSAQLMGPAAIVEERQPTAVLQHRFVARRDRDAPRVLVPAGSAWSLRPAASVNGHRHGSAPNVTVLTDICEGPETNHAVERCTRLPTGDRLPAKLEEWRRPGHPRATSRSSSRTGLTPCEGAISRRWPVGWPRT